MPWVCGPWGPFPGQCSAPSSCVVSLHSRTARRTNAPIFQGGFAALKNGWRWPFYELLWISAFALLVLSFLLPETLDSTILVRRAERLRKLTGNPLLRTQTEIDAKEGETALGLATENFVLAFKLSLEPALLFSHVYIALVYAIFYLWFEVSTFACRVQPYLAKPKAPRLSQSCSRGFTTLTSASQASRSWASWSPA